MRGMKGVAWNKNRGASAAGRVDVDGAAFSDRSSINAWAGRDSKDVIAEAYERDAKWITEFVLLETHDLPLAEDITQETFLIGLQAWDDLRDPASLRPWLYGIARNLVARHREKRTRRGPTEDLADHGDLADPHRGPEDVVIADELGRLVWEAAGALEERQRQALVLACRQQLSTTEIAQALGVTPRHAAAIVPKARASLAAAVGARLVLRDRASCPKLGGALDTAGADDTLTPHTLRIVRRHIRDCSTCQTRRHRQTRPWELLGGLVILPAGWQPPVFDPTHRLPSDVHAAQLASRSLLSRSVQRPSPLRSLLTTPAIVAGTGLAIAVATLGGAAAIRRGSSTPDAPVAALASPSAGGASSALPKPSAPASVISATAAPAVGSSAIAAPPPDEATKSTTDIWNDTLSDVRASSSYHIAYTTTAFGSDATQFDLVFGRTGDYAGGITLATSPSDPLQVRKVAGVIYVQAQGVARQPDNFGLTAAQATQLGSGWLILGSAGPQADVATLVDRAVAPFADPRSLANGILSPDLGASTGGTDVIGGQRVIVLRDPNGVLEVTDSPNPFPVRLDGDYDHLAFTDFNATPAISAPANAQRMSTG